MLRSRTVEGCIRGAAVAPIMQQHAITVGGNRLGQIDQFGIGPAASGRKRDEGAVGADDFVIDVKATNERNRHFVSTSFFLIYGVLAIRQASAQAAENQSSNRSSAF